MTKTTEEKINAYARLVTINAISKARVESNPGPYIKAALDQAHRYRQALEQARQALAGEVVIEEVDRFIPLEYRGIREEALARNRAAQDIINEALSERRKR